jgi:hypothetical protein
MKSILRVLMAAALLSAPAGFAQNGPRQGGGSTGTPHAYCDKDGDGICDYCGRPAGQCTGPHGNAPRRGGGPNPNCPNPSCPRNGSGPRR